MLEGGGQAVPENCEIWGLIADLRLSVGNRTLNRSATGLVSSHLPLLRQVGASVCEVAEGRAPICVTVFGRMYGRPHVGPSSEVVPRY